MHISKLRVSIYLVKTDTTSKTNARRPTGGYIKKVFKWSCYNFIGDSENGVDDAKKDFEEFKKSQY
jgi:hypothetical protein